MTGYIRYFLIFALISLIAGVIFGTLASFQFLYPELLNTLPFYKLRPLHVSLVVAWIFLASSGCILYFFRETLKETLRGEKMSIGYLVLFLSAGMCMLLSYLQGKFGGREYWEAQPWVSAMVASAWILFMIIFFRNVFLVKGRWPVYLWMWSTGVIFFLFTFAEAHAWLLPHFNNNVVRDVTVQWKAYGALVGSWNMLVYGLAIYVTEKITGDNTASHSTLSFSMYFLGFFNLLFGWAHHIYIVPCSPWIRGISYAVSMTELIILFRIIWFAGKAVKKAGLMSSSTVYKFLFSADIWVFLNLTLALIISVPAINLYTHGTHVTVAHAMGSTIGINTFILFAAIVLITGRSTALFDSRSHLNHLRSGMRLLNVSLFLFWILLIIAGVKKGIMVISEGASHAQVMPDIEPYLLAFAVAGIGVCLSVIVVSLPLLSNLILNKASHESKNVL